MGRDLQRQRLVQREGGREGDSFSGGLQSTGLLWPKPRYCPLLSALRSLRESASLHGSEQDIGQALSTHERPGTGPRVLISQQSQVCASAASHRRPQRPLQEELSLFLDDEQRARTGTCPRDLDPLGGGGVEAGLRG